MTQQHIEDSIQAALGGKSGLSQSVLDIRGFSTPTIRHLFSNLCNINGTYLEIGLFCGATFVSSFNEKLTTIGIENHSQDFSEGFEKVKDELKNNISIHADRAKEIYVHYEDCFAIDKALLPDDIDIYFFDGFHSFETQSKALPHFIDKMAKKFIWVVDDFNWQYVADGTNAALEQLKDEIEIERVWLLRGYHLQNDPIYHNGLCIYLINKK